METVSRLARLMSALGALALIAYVAITLIEKPRGPVVKFFPEKMKAEVDDQPGVILWRHAYIKYRDDCPVDARTIYLVDSEGVTFALTTAKGGTAGSPKTRHGVAFDTSVHALTINGNVKPAPGPATLKGSLTYRCADGLKTVEYPDTPITLSP